MKTSTLKKIIVTCFVAVPILSSIISTIHLVDLFYLGNPSWISYTVAVAIEIGAVASFLTLSILSRLNKSIVWGMFILLFFMQVIGNVYFSYDWISKKIAENPNWMKNFKEMMEFFIFEIEEKTAKMTLALLIGVPIPLISVFLLKSTTDYLGNDVEAPKIEKPLDTLTPDVSDTTVEIIEEKENASEEKKPDEDEIHITDRNRKRIHPSRT